jgi:ElaB/YqjD/DUF883 family membrane-anchored ribosome-binding protein
MADNNWQERASNGGRTASRASDEAPDYQAEIEKVKAEMTKLAETVAGSVQNTMKPVARELEATVTRNPTASVLIAAGIGLVLGIMMSRS